MPRGELIWHILLLEREKEKEGGGDGGTKKRRFRMRGSFSSLSLPSSGPFFPLLPCQQLCGLYKLRSPPPWLGPLSVSPCPVHARGGSVPPSSSYSAGGNRILFRKEERTETFRLPTFPYEWTTESFFLTRFLNSLFMDLLSFCCIAASASSRLKPRR